jgi:hypothetical protein
MVTSREEIEERIFHWNEQITWDYSIFEHSGDALRAFLEAWLDLVEYYQTRPDGAYNPRLTDVYLRGKNILYHVSVDPEQAEETQGWAHEVSRVLGHGMTAITFVLENNGGPYEA